MRGLIDRAMDYLANAVSKNLVLVEEETQTKSIPSKGGAQYTFTFTDKTGYTFVGIFAVSNNHGNTVFVADIQKRSAYFANQYTSAQNTTVTARGLYVRTNLIA